MHKYIYIYIWLTWEYFTKRKAIFHDFMGISYDELVYIYIYICYVTKKQITHKTDLSIIKCYVKGLITYY